MFGRKEKRLDQPKLLRKSGRRREIITPKFFHAIVSYSRHGSVISKMHLEDGTMLDSTKTVRLGAVDFFQNFLGEMSSTKVADLSPFLG